MMKLSIFPKPRPHFLLFLFCAAFPFRPALRAEQGCPPPSTPQNTATQPRSTTPPPNILTPTTRNVDQTVHSTIDRANRSVNINPQREISQPVQRLLCSPQTMEILDAPGWMRVEADRHSTRAAWAGSDADGYRDFAEQIRRHADAWRELADAARRNAERNRQRARDARRDGREKDAQGWDEEAGRDDAEARARDEEAHRLDGQSNAEKQKEADAREQERQARADAERAREEARRIERERSERERQRAEDEARRQQAERDSRRAEQERVREENRRAEQERRDAQRRQAQRDYERQIEDQNRQAEERRARAQASGREAERTGGRGGSTQGRRPPQPQEQEPTTWADYVIEYGGAAIDWVLGKAGDKVKEEGMDRTGITHRIEDAGLDGSVGALGDGIDQIRAVKNLGDSMEEELRRMPSARQRIEDRIDNLSDPRSNTNRREPLTSGSLYGGEVKATVARMVEANQ